ncbi:MAG: hypothetical protein JO099_08595, partial [Acidobacteriia bacterium]|nr:hypothetical protein [Terriglobia bacterium]
MRITFWLAYLVAYVLFLVFMEVNTAAGQGIWNAVFYAFIFGTGASAAHPRGDG